MARVNDSLLGGTSGRTGRIVIANVNGIDISRNRPKARSGKGTDKQQQQQSRFSASVAFLSLYKSFARLYFGKQHKLSSPYNQAFANVMEQCTIVEDSLTFDYPAIMISKGNIPVLAASAVTASADHTLTIEWYDNVGSESIAAADQLALFVYSPVLKDGQLFTEVALRSDMTASVSVIPYFSGQEVHVWGTFYRASSVDASRSSYLGTLTIT